MATTRVAGSNYSNDIGGAADTATSITVVAGDTVLVGFIGYAAGTAVAPTITKSSGTSTIGTIVTRKSFASVLGTQLRLDIIEVPVTGSGTLVLHISSVGNDDATWGFEAVRGLPSVSIVVPAGTTGSGTTYSAPAVVAPSGTTDGFVVALFTDDSGSNLGYTLSDTLAWKFTDGTSGVTGGQNGKIVTGAGSNTLTLTSTGSQAWQGIAVGYFDSAGGGGGGGATPRGTIHLVGGRQRKRKAAGRARPRVMLLATLLPSQTPASPTRRRIHVVT